MPNLILKKPSELDKPIQVEYLYSTNDGNGIATYCPECGLEYEFMFEWPIDIPIVCINKECTCRFIITNNTPIEN